MDRELPAAYMLLALLLSADKRLPEALDVTVEAMQDYPNHYGLMVLRLKLEMAIGKRSSFLERKGELKISFSTSSVRYLYSPKRSKGGFHVCAKNDH